MAIIVSGGTDEDIRPLGNREVAVRGKENPSLLKTKTEHIVREDSISSIYTTTEKWLPRI
jgi:hypothetical protein